MNNDLLSYLLSDVMKLPILIILLSIFFKDSIREMRKFAHDPKSEASMFNQQGAVDHLHMRQFRAQRNFYISGFALFLWM